MPYHFPADLARQVEETWSATAQDGYRPPALPRRPQLRQLLEVAYLAGMETDEARYLSFMLCCTPEVERVRRPLDNSDADAWVFTRDRAFNIQEVRRLSTVADLDTAAIWVRCADDPDRPPLIHGLLNLGSSWARARYAFAYHFLPLPDALLIRVPAPGRVLVYQGQMLLASLQSGMLQSGQTLSPFELLGAYPLFMDGYQLLRAQIPALRDQPAPDWRQSEWMVYVNTVLAIVNSVRLRAHGGALIVAGASCELEGFLRIKYKLQSASVPLKQRFVDLVTLREQYGTVLGQSGGTDAGRSAEDGLRDLKLMSFELEEAQQRLADTCRFVANFSGTDGAIVMRTDLSVEGFGTEIRLNKIRPSKVYKVEDPWQRQREEYRSESFGMRHRSALRLSSAVAELVVFVVSQDGEVTLIWNDEGQVCFKQGLKTTDLNMVLA